MVAPAVAAVWLARAAIFVMVIYFTVLDAIGGIGLGRSILAVQSLAAAGKLSPQQVEGAALLLNTLWVDPLVGGVGSFVSETASWAAFAASVFIAAALLLSRRAGWAQHGGAGGLRLGAADRSCRTARPDRLRAPDRGVGLAVVQSNTPRRCSASMMRATSASKVVFSVRRCSSGPRAARRASRCR